MINLPYHPRNTPGICSQDPLPLINHYTYILELPHTYETYSMSCPLYHVTTPTLRSIYIVLCNPCPTFPTLLLIILSYKSLPYHLSSLVSISGIPLCHVSSTPQCLGLRHSVSRSNRRTSTLLPSCLCVSLLDSIRNYTMFS